jgi:para-nitrobenzyl esterase
VPRQQTRWGWLFAALAATFAGAALAGAPVEVRISQGRILGDAAADGVRVFRGIPYAAPPVGELRWRDPRPPAPWSGVRDARTFGARCTQPAGNVGGRVPDAISNLPISEDCLYLNVWTAAARARERRPVIVWIHGGSYIISTGAQFDGSALARHGAVVVSINYRLGAFGFLAHPRLSAESPRKLSGNYGFADTLAALSWVRKNIATFGGDPRLVTIMGQSAGGRFVQVLRTSPCAEKLFHRAIIQSAPVRIMPMPRLADAEREGAEAAGKLSVASPGELRALSAQQVLENFPPPQPVIDGQCIPDDPWRRIDAGRSHGGELLVGSNADEGTFPYLRARQLGMGFDNATEYTAHVRQRFGAGAEAFLTVYPAGSETAFKQAQLDAFRDEVAWSATYSAATHARHGRRTAFLYLFAHRPPSPAAGPDRGATHGAEIPYATNAPRPNWRDEDRRVAESMSNYWFNFAARGDPNGPGLPPWPAYVPGKAEFALELGPMTPAVVLDSRRIAVFDALYRAIYGDRNSEGGE